jgi:hypothetical protein
MGQIPFIATVFGDFIVFLKTRKRHFPTISQRRFNLHNVISSLFRSLRADISYISRRQRFGYGKTAEFAGKTRENPRKNGPLKGKKSGKRPGKTGIRRARFSGF